MRSFRRAVRRSRWLVVLVLLCTFSYSVEAYNYSHSYRVAREEEKRLAEIAQRLGVPVEKLRREQPGLIESLRGLFTDEEAEARKAGQRRVEAQLKKMAEQVEANPYRPQIEEVKNAYQSHRLDGLLRDLTQLSSTDVVSLPVASRKALLKNVRKSLEEDLEPYVPDSLPPKAKGKHHQLKGRLHALYGKLRRILDDPDALSDPKLAQTLGKIAAEVNDEVHRPQRGPRFADRPLPLQLREQTVRTEEVTQPVGAPSSAMVASRSTTPPAARRIAAAAVAPEIAALAQSLGNSPARIFAHVHDNVRFDPKWGAVRSPLGTLQETEGTSWDQAWLLLELLTAAGVEARVEWGQIEIPASLLLTLTGTSNPLDAGNLLSTGGIPAVLLTQGGQVVGARLGHVWVKAHIDYIPDRGVKPGTPDAWVRMDPSLKRYGFAAGIDVHSQVPFDLGNYLQSGTEQAPRRAYEDALWAYIRANNIDCVNLEQLKKAAQVVRERFPFVPGTFRGKILRVDGEQATVPESFQQRLTLEVKTAAGTSLVAWSTPAPAVYGKRVEIDYIGATSDDQAALDAYGGVFETPPYLVDLKPVVRVAGAPAAQGAAVGSAADTEVWVTMTAPTGPPTVVTHVTSAGERHILAADFGQIPQPVLDTHLAAQAAARAAGNASEEEAEALFLIGAQYLHNLGRDLTDISGWKWQRLVRLGTEGLITQTGVVTTTVGGAPISFRRGQRNVDIALMPLGMVPADGRRQFRREAFELLGAQSSFLEGEVFNQVLQREGIAAVSALTLSKRAGQELTRVDGGNVNAVLEQADLGADAEAEIREGIARGRIAWVAESQVAVRRWLGTGYVLEDPATGAAAYLISGGLAGGAEVDPQAREFFLDLLGSEGWLGLVGPASFLTSFVFHMRGEAGGPLPDPPATTQSDPINMATGNMWRSEIDLKLATRGPQVVWGRTYNSRSTHAGPLGFGWTFNYGERLEELSDGSILYREGDGTEHLFRTDNDGGFAPPRGKHLSLVKAQSGFTLTTRYGFVTRFLSDGRLSSLEDSNGNNIKFFYDSDSDLQRVVDATGRTVLSITKAGGRISSVSDISGRIVRYSYTGDDLTGVVDSAGMTWTYSYDDEHNLITFTDPLENSDTYAYDALDRCYAHTDALGNQEGFAYTRTGRQGVVTDRRGFDTYLEIDELSRALLEVDPLGNPWSSEWDSSNNRVSTTDPRGGTTTRTFDANGNLLSETNALGQQATYTYEPQRSRLLARTDASGHAVTYSYDDRGNVLETRQVVQGEARIETAVYDDFGQLIERTDANGNRTVFSRDADTGSLSSILDPLGGTTTLTTDAVGRLTSITDPEGHVAHFAWDDRDRILTVEDLFGNLTNFEYDGAGRKIAVTDPRGTTRMLYDQVGRTLEVVNPLGQAVLTEYDPSGNVTTRVDPRGNRTRSTYDAIGRAITVVDPLGQVWTYGYCAEISAGCNSCSGGGSSSGSFCELTDPLGNTVRKSFDKLGRVETVMDPSGHLTRLIYDELGRTRSVIDASNRETKYEYDALGRLSAVVEANGARTGYRYDGNGNLINIRDAEGRDWPRTYDALNRMSGEGNPLNQSTTYTHDAIGNLLSKRTPNGDLISFEYEIRRLKSVVLPGGARETFEYDGLGRLKTMSNAEVLLSYEYDALDRMTKVTNQTLGQALIYTYDASGNRTAVDGPKGRATYFYDARNRLVEQRDPASGTYLFDYDSVDRRIGLTYPNRITTSYEYDRDSHLTSILTRNDLGNVIDGYRYTHDPVGNRTSMTGLRDTATHAYEYDELDRLTRRERGAGQFETYSYDRVGNRLKLQSEKGEVTYSYDAANRLLSELKDLGNGIIETTSEWDANGNLVRSVSGADVTTYQWDALNRLVEVSGSSRTQSYGYDPQGIRVRSTGSTGSERYLYSGFNILGVYDEGGSLGTYFTHGPAVDEPLAEERVGGEALFLHRDGLGSVTALSSPSGQLSGTFSYAAFGQVEESTGEQSRYQYTGRELDATGLMYYRARYYQPNSGRFLSQDTFAGCGDLPASFNRYAYAHNNPVNLTDPTGQTPLLLPQSEVFSLGGLLNVHGEALVLASTTTMPMPYPGSPPYPQGAPAQIQVPWAVLVMALITLLVLIILFILNKIGVERDDDTHRHCLDLYVMCDDPSLVKRFYQGGNCQVCFDQCRREKEWPFHRCKFLGPWSDWPTSPLEA